MLLWSFRTAGVRDTGSWKLSGRAWPQEGPPPPGAGALRGGRGRSLTRGCALPREQIFDIPGLSGGGVRRATFSLPPAPDLLTVSGGRDTWASARVGGPEMGSRAPRPASTCKESKVLVARTRRAKDALSFLSLSPCPGGSHFRPGRLFL